MGFPQEAAALTVPLPHATKHVLQVMAFHACERCGRAWPGVPTLVKETGLGDRAVRSALADLRGRPDLVTVHAYPNGGCGVATEYIVMPGVARFSPAECGRCASRGDTLHQPQGNALPPAGNPARRRVKTLRTGTDQPSENHQPSARGRAQGGAASPQTAINLPDIPTPSQFAENARQAREMIERLGVHVTAPEPPHGHGRKP